MTTDIEKKIYSDVKAFALTFLNQILSTVKEFRAERVNENLLQIDLSNANRWFELKVCYNMKDDHLYLQYKSLNNVTNDFELMITLDKRELPIWIHEALINGSTIINGIDTGESYYKLLQKFH